MGKASKGSTAYDAFLKSQRDFLKDWYETSENYQKIFGEMDWSKRVTKDTRDLFNVYDLWIKTFGSYFDVMLKNSPMNVRAETTSKLFSGADAYMKLYGFWEPLIKAVQEKPFEPASYKYLLDPAKYKEMINKIFGFGSPETLAEFYGQASKIIETWGSGGELFVKPWSEAIKSNIDAVLDLASGEPEAGLNIFHNVYSAFESTFGKAFKLPAIGKDREEIEAFLKTLDRHSVFLAKNTEFQHLIYNTGQEAMEKVVETLAQNIREKGEIASFDEFFKLWTAVNEKTYLELFQTEKFSKLQGVVLDSALDVRRHFHQLMELSLSDFPIALRSEMDDVYKKVYGLNRKVRELMKANSGMDEMREEIEALRKKVAALEKKQRGAVKRKTRKEATK
jgi:class III poly(R)-hydroxyalkanoic acid synthase PhaE subunit